jgi:hypothetical protein
VDGNAMSFSHYEFSWSDGRDDAPLQARHVQQCPYKIRELSGQVTIFCFAKVSDASRGRTMNDNALRGHSTLFFALPLTSTITGA